MLTNLSPAVGRLSRVALAALWLTPVVLRAQVGHRPSSSPYEDVKPGQSVSLSGGWLAVSRDPAGVAPRAAAFGQFRYDVGIGGPAALYARYGVSMSERTLFAPSAVATARQTGTPGVAMHMIDGGLDLALTGKKSWHHLIPALGAGVGIVSDFASVDSGGYQFGVKFAITYGASLRYVRASGLQLRIDATSYRWQYDYPDRYFVKATDGTSILEDTKNRSAWRGNWGLSAGVTYPIFR
jgi:hypothetical protein